VRGLRRLSLIALFLTGCAGKDVPGHSSPKAPPGEFHRVQGDGIENLYALGDHVYSGSAPEGDAGFATLRNLGVKTVLSVDGMVPDTALAAKHGLRYVHIPVGYDGIAASNAVMIVKAAQTLPGPIFVHCHHGLHRGPTAAAIACEGIAGWTPEQAEAWLHAAGTATNYPGLYRTVREFRPPTESALRHVPAQFTAHARTPDLVNTMVQVDDHFAMLKAFQETGFKSLPNHPDTSAVNESLLLYELFREAHRTRQGSERGEQFIAQVGKAETSAGDLHKRLQELGSDPALAPQAETAFRAMTENCATCHKSYRN